MDFFLLICRNSCNCRELDSQATWYIYFLKVTENTYLHSNIWNPIWLDIGFPPEFRVPVYVRKWSGNFFHFHYGKGYGNPEFRNDLRNDFFCKPIISGTLFWNYGTLRNSVPEKSGLRNNCSWIFWK